MWVQSNKLWLCYWANGFSHCGDVATEKLLHLLSVFINSLKMRTIVVLKMLILGTYFRVGSFPVQQEPWAYVYSEWVRRRCWKILLATRHRFSLAVSVHYNDRIKHTETIKTTRRKNPHDSMCWLTNERSWNLRWSDWQTKLKEEKNRL